APPRTPLERSLAQIFQAVLKLERVGRHDSFFDLGGHSLLAVQLMARIETQLGAVLPLATLFRASTVEQLAKALQNRDIAGPASSVLALQPKGSRPPFFCLPGIGGHVIGFRELANLVGPNQPFYGLQPQGLDGTEPPHTRIEDMAEYAIEQMQRIQAHGPYFIGGYSAGGVVAYEMAQQLQQKGETIGLLVLLDTRAPGYRPIAPFAVRIGLHLKHMLHLTLSDQFRYLRDHLLSRLRQFDGAARKELLSYLPDAGDSLSRTIQDVAGTFAEALRRYVPKPYAGRITLLGAAQRPQWLGASFDDPSLGWSQLALRGVMVRTVSGTHLGILATPNINFMARELDSCLRAAQSAYAPASESVSATTR
ncbi:MAG: thioesterase domain-containing protein, partial [Bacillota bacterium]